jgi:hypothetical protein
MPKVKAQTIDSMISTAITIKEGVLQNAAAVMLATETLKRLPKRIKLPETVISPEGIVTMKWKTKNGSVTIAIAPPAMASVVIVRDGAKPRIIDYLAATADDLFSEIVVACSY